MILQEIIKKCKSLESDKIFVPTVIILVGIGAFGLGRLSKIESLKTGISISAPQNVANVINSQKTAENGNLGLNSGLKNETTSQNTSLNTTSESGQVVASKSGTKYHFPWCTGAKSIAEKNKIWFNSIEDARKAGYQPASNCKGLK